MLGRCSHGDAFSLLVGVFLQTLQMFGGKDGMGFPASSLPDLGNGWLPDTGICGSGLCYCQLPLTAWRLFSFFEMKNQKAFLSLVRKALKEALL